MSNTTSTTTQESKSARQKRERDGMENSMMWRYQAKAREIARKKYATELNDVEKKVREDAEKIVAQYREYSKTLDALIDKHPNALLRDFGERPHKQHIRARLVTMIKSNDYAEEFVKEMRHALQLWKDGEAAFKEMPPFPIEDDSDDDDDD